MRSVLPANIPEHVRKPANDQPGLSTFNEVLARLNSRSTPILLQTLVAAVVAPQLVQRILRHSSRSTTMAFYALAQAQDDYTELKTKLILPVP
jgi:hypothetical protein